MTIDPSGPGPIRPVPACLDQATLQQLLALDDGATGLLAELFTLFKEDTPERLAEMEEAMATGDAQTTAELAHALKGAAGTLGASRMRSIAQEIEQAAKAGRVDAETRRRIEELKEVYSEACSALAAFLSPD